MKRIAIAAMGLLSVVSLTACGPKSTTTTVLVNPDGTCSLEVHKRIPGEPDELGTYFIPCPEGVNTNP